MIRKYIVLVNYTTIHICIRNLWISRIRNIWMFWLRTAGIFWIFIATFITVVTRARIIECPIAFLKTNSKCQFLIIFQIYLLESPDNSKFSLNDWLKSCSSKFSGVLCQVLFFCVSNSRFWTYIYDKSFLNMIFLKLESQSYFELCSI